MSHIFKVDVRRVAVLTALGVSAVLSLVQLWGILSGAGATDFGIFAEAGVRYIEVCHAGWDQHKNLKQAITRNCSATDQPITRREYKSMTVARNSQPSPVRR